MSMQARGVVSREERLPRSFDTVTADWLTRFLAPAYPGLQVLGMDVVQFIEGHTTKVRIKVSLNRAGRDAGIPEELCLKANWTDNERSSAVCIDEARFYNDLPSCLSVPAPRAFFADWDDDAISRQGIVVLEDLVPKGGTFSTSASGIGGEDAALAVKGLAALHGTSWGSADLERLDWLQTSLAADVPSDDYWTLLEDVMTVRNRDPQRLAILPEWIADDPDSLRTAFAQLCRQERADQGPLCLIHGDAHLGNTYRLPGGERLWFDWQLPRKGRPWRDYTYFIIGSMPVEERRHHERDLFQAYLDAMAVHGTTLDPEQAWRDYRRWVIWGLIAWQCNINPHEPSEEVLDRFSRAAEDLKIDELYESWR